MQRKDFSSTAFLGHIFYETNGFSGSYLNLLKIRQVIEGGI